LKKQISIIGCGWLGFPLAKYLISNGYKIKGSTTSKGKLKKLKTNSIEGFVIRLNETEISGNYSKFLEGSSTVIINIPPGLRKHPEKNHVAEIQHLASAIEAHKVINVLYVSSTSVFEDAIDIPQIIDSTSPNASSKNAKQLIKIEQMLLNNNSFNTIILRFGGLFDETRHPAKYLSGKNNISNPEAPINLIHQEDCIHIIANLIKNNLWNVSLNAVNPYHPNKKEYYTTYCKDRNLPLPEFNTSEKSNGKIVESLKLVQLLNYSFEHSP